MLGPEHEEYYCWDVIKSSDLKAAVERYPEHVPSGLEDLEKARLITLPRSLRERKNNGNSYLDRQQLLELVEWKL